MQPTAAGISALLVIMFLDKLNSDCVIRCLCTKLELKLLARLRELFSFWKPIPILQFFGGFVPWQVTKAQPPDCTRDFHTGYTLTLPSFHLKI